MKKIFVMLITLFLFIGGIEAKSLVKTCDYRASWEMPYAAVHVEISVYDNNTYEAKAHTIAYFDKTYVSSEKGKKYSTSSETTIASGKCPRYIYVFPKAFAGSGYSAAASQRKIYMSDTDPVLDGKCVGECISALSSDFTLSQDQINEGNKLLDDVITQLTTTITYFKEYDIKSSECYKENKIAPYGDCVSSLEDRYRRNASSVKDVESLKNSNEYWNDNAKVEIVENLNKDFNRAWEVLKGKLDAAVAEENVKYWEKHNAATGNNQYASNLERAKEELRKAKENLARIEADKESNQADISCDGLIGKNTLEILRIVKNILMIVGPALAVVLGTYDMVQAVASGEDDAKKKGIKRFRGRLIAAALLLLIPEIIFIVLQISDKAGASCI